ncbi:MAG: VWA domain-containing protein [Cyanobacteriota bacterium]|nr:VWA domain-containing protein [Cyanobacteriota bacterium]
MLANRDYTLIIDKSSSMAVANSPNGKSRWSVIQESTLALAQKCEELDPDGLTIYTFSGRFRRYDYVTADKVSQIFLENLPSGRSDLVGVLQDALDRYFTRKDKGETKPNGETILVVTDGEPDDCSGVARIIVDASQRIDCDEELAISFIQAGDNPEATRFLKILDDDLAKAGAKFDIVDTVTIEQMRGMSLTDVLMDAILD